MKMMRVLAMAGVCSLVGVGVAARGQGGAKPTHRDESATNGAPNQTKRAMTFADLMAMKRVSDPQISPSGKWVMFSVTDVDLEKNTKVNHLWLVGLDGGGGAKTTLEILGGGQNDGRAGGGGGERQITFGEGESFGRFSPDGKTISLTMKDQLFEMPWDDAAGKVGDAIQVTNVAGGADGAVWSPDSKRLMFVADVWPECSVNPPKQSLDGAPGFGAVVGGARDVSAWKGAEPVGGAEEDACDKAKDEAVDKTPVKGQVWEGLLYRHWDHYLGVKRSHVLVVDADSGRNLRDLTPASVVGDAETPTFFLGGVQNYAWAPDSKEIAYVTNLDAVPAASTNNDVFTLRLDEAGAKAVKVSTSPGSDDGPAYSPDGKWLAFRSQARGGFESDRFRLMLFDREKKTIEQLMSSFDGWVDEFAWAPDSDSMYFASGFEGEEPVYRFRVRENDLARRATKSTSGSGELGELQVALSGTALVATGMAVNFPARIVAFPLDPPSSVSSGVVPPKHPTHELTYLPTYLPDTRLYGRDLTHLDGPLLSQLDLSPLEAFSFEGAEGTNVEGFLIKPPGFDPAKKYPVKFLMHGGPQTAWGDGWSYRWNWELMAANGYVVVGINRRGSTGYGQKFVDEVSGDWGGRAYVDLMKGLDYAEGHYPFLDKTRECALGASYGGFMADWVLTHTNRFKCIVTHDGMYDPASAYGDTEEMWFNEWEFRRPEDFPKGWDGFQPQQSKIAGDPGVADPTHAQSARVNGAPAVEGRPAEPWRYAALPADQDPFRKWSPMLHIQDAKTPTLIIHSQKDYRLDVSQGIALFTALQRLGVPSKMLYFPDEGHWVLKPQNSQMWNEVVGDWCDRWTKTGKYAER